MSDWKDLLSTFNTITPKPQSNQPQKPEVSFGARRHSNNNYSYTKDNQTVIKKRGVIFTNTRKLAYKYFGADRVKLDNGEVVIYSSSIKQTLLDYIKALNDFGVAYELFDINSTEYNYGDIKESSEFRVYLNMLDDYCIKKGISTEAPQYLFIIGGQDVIPMAQLHNPSVDSDQEKLDSSDMEITIDTDFPYAYPSNVISLNKAGELSLDSLSDCIGCPRFYVGRLPLENGYLKTTIKDDLYDYLLRSFDAHKEGGINITSPLMTTMRCAINVGEQLIQGIPVMAPEGVPEDMCAANMITSPSLSLDKDRCIGAQTYSSKIRESDMLIFLLHGTNAPSCNYYSGEDRNKDNQRFFSIAFTPELLNAGKIKSIATGSCYGARFINYDRNDSTLLTAIYKDTLCFMGSSRIAYGDFDDTFAAIKKDIGEPLLRLSNRLMQYYLEFLFSGVPGGKALFLAKIRYLVWVVSGQSPSGNAAIPNGMTTVQEFNFFGDPSLHMCPLIPAIPNQSCPKGLKNYIKQGDSWSRDSTAISFNNNSKQGNLLDRVRHLIDNRFEQIQSELTEKLSKEWGLNPKNLHSVNKYKTRNGEEGFCLRYRFSDKNMSSDTIVYSDLNGNVIDIFYTY